MHKAKRQRLERKGWKIGNTEGFLNLTSEEKAYTELKLALSQSVRKRRVRKHLTQAELARRLESSQSRVAKIEAGDSSVSLDLLVRSAMAMGATRKDIAQAIVRPQRKQAPDRIGPAPYFFREYSIVHPPWQWYNVQRRNLAQENIHPLTRGLSMDQANQDAGGFWPTQYLEDVCSLTARLQGREISHEGDTPPWRN